jgi:CHAT domain-containing protein
MVWTIEGTKASLLEAIGLTQFDLGNYPKAIEDFEKTLSIRRLMKDPFGEAATLANLGNVYGRLGEKEKALDYLEQSLRQRRAIGDRRGEALSLQNAGELYRVHGDLTRAMTYFQQGLEISREIRNQYYEANLLYALARSKRSAGRADEARQDIEAAIEIVESMRARVSSGDLRASFFASKQQFYECEIDLLMESYAQTHDRTSLIKAFDVSEKQRARTFIDTLEDSRANVRSGISSELLNRERSLRLRLSQEAEKQIKLISGSHTPEDAAAQAKLIQEISSDYDQVRAEIRSSNQHYAALTQPVPLTLQEVQSRVLDPNTLLLEYSLGADHSYVWAVSTDGVTAFQLPSRTELETLARRAYELMTARNHFVEFERVEARKARIAKADAEYEQVAAELSRILLGPALNHSTRKRLLIVSDGALQYLSFAALAAPQSGKTFIPMISRYEIVNLPSASTLGVLRKELAGRKPAPKTVAVLADPVFDKDDERVKQAIGLEKTAHQQDQRAGGIADEQLTRSMRDLAMIDAESKLPLPRLRFTRLEAEAIVSLTAPGERQEALDFAANRATAIDPQLSRYRYVHFATHALVNNRHPELSGIVLSLFDQDGKEQDGFLLANEIYNLNLPAELVVLSGCKTGLGKQIKGEGFVSLTRSFMYAGAARVVVSLWDVNDRSTAELMTQFYRGTLGKRRLAPAAALREAQTGMSRSDRWRAPYYWAAFVLQGEYY